MTSLLVWLTPPPHISTQCLQERPGAGNVNLAPHMCGLYYLLLYEDTLDNNRKTLCMYSILLHTHISFPI